MPYHFDPFARETDDYEDDAFDPFFERTSARASRPRVERTEEASPRRKSRTQRPPRTEADQAFKCGHCKQFIGAPISGGRQRNHCPNCLYSKHVDDTMPGDRKSDCHSLMAPLGIISRRNGEEQILHRCLGCGKIQPNRIAADDHPVLLEELPHVSLSDYVSAEEQDAPIEP
ncbi:MAG TPA: RNHCP domain-containing protein [Thermomicrobiales bacterium]|nr:RNHCP domain-containing protein [Thermomicrobiales bacterium]